MIRTLLRYSVILVVILFFFACKEKKESNQLLPSKLSPEDSSIIKILDNKIILRDYDDLFKLIDSIKKTNKFENVLDYRYNVLIKEAFAYSRIAKYEKALQILNNYKEEIYSNEKYQLHYVNAILLKGDIYFLLGNYQVAYKYLYEGRTASEKLSSFCQLAQYDYRLGIILFKQEKYAESITFFKQSFDKYNSCNGGFNNLYKQQEITSNIGLCFYKIGVYDSSIYYYDKAAEIVEATQVTDASEEKYMKMARGVISGNTGKAYIAKNKFDKAIPLLEKNIQINTSANLDYNDALTSVLALSKIYLDKKDDANFIKTISIADKYEDSTDSELELHKIYKLKADYYKYKGQYKLAYDFQSKSISLKDSLDKINSSIKNSDILLSIQSLENENQINILQRENKINNIYYYISITVSIIFIIGIFVSYILLTQFRDRQRQLEEANSKISEQTDLLKQANDEILKNIDALKKRDIEKNRIMNMLAHDLQAPNIQVISIINQLLKSENTDSNEKELLKSIHTTLLNNNDLVQEILLFSKSNISLKEKSYQAVLCKELITQVIDTNYFKAKQKNIELVIKNADISTEIYVHQESIRRALSNILQNAIKFSHRNTKISVFTTSTKDIVNIHIKDEGIGIPDRIKSMVFESDPLVRRLGTEGEPTFGLGLTLVKQIVEDHSGHLTFNSDANGTEFIISLPTHKQNS
jgi:signal transduction histidine kinase